MTDYYCHATNGNDANPGTEVQPWKTLSRANNQSASPKIQAGDRVFLSGIFRETFTATVGGASGNPIAFLNYPGESATINAAEVVPNNWTQHAPNIWKQTLSSTWNLGDGKNQVFADGVMLCEARYPHLPSGVGAWQLRTEYALAITAGARVSDSGSTRTATITHPDFANFGSWIVGAKGISSFGYGWRSIAFTITAISGSTLTLTYTYSTGFTNPAVESPQAQDPVIIYGDRLELLGGQNEYYFDITGRYGAAFTLYIYGDPSGKTFQMKRRQQCVNIGSSFGYLTFKNINLFGGSFETDGTGVVLEADVPTESIYGAHELLSSPKQAISLRGNGCTIRGYKVHRTSDCAIYLRGSSEICDNVEICNAGYFALSLAPLDMHASQTNQTVTRTTVYDVPSIAISFGGTLLNFSYNQVHSFGYWITDIAGFNAWNRGDGQGSVVYRCVSARGVSTYDLARKKYGSQGFRLDSGPASVAVNGASGYWFVRCIAFDMSNAGFAVWRLQSNQPNYLNANIEILNCSTDSPIHINDPGSAAGIRIRNTATCDAIDLDAEATYSTNLVKVHRTTFADPDLPDATPKANSEPIDAGTAIAPYATGTPDIGAIERGESPWVAGAVVLESQLSGLSVSAIAEGNLVKVTITGSAGRKLPADFKVRIGSAIATAPTNKIDYATGEVTATIDVDIASQSGAQNLDISIGGTTWTSKGTIDVTPLIIYTVSPNPTVPGEEITIAGNRFVTASPVVYTRIISFSGNTTNLYNYECPFAFDFAPAIAMGKMSAGRVKFLDAAGQELEYWLDSDSTRVWINVPVLIANQTTQILMVYGMGVPQKSNGKKAFTFFDDFTAGFFSTTSDPYAISGTSGRTDVSVGLVNGAIEITTTNTPLANRYNRFGFSLRTSNYFPSNCAIDCLASMNQTIASPSSFALGGHDEAIAIRANNNADNSDRRAAWTSSTTGVTTFLADSDLDGNSFTKKWISIAYLSNGTIQHREEGVLKASRTGATGVLRGFFDYAPFSAGVSATLKIHRIIIRKQPPPGGSEPSATIGSEIKQGGTIALESDGASFSSIAFDSPLQLRSVVPALNYGQHNLKITLPSGETYTLIDAFLIEDFQVPLNSRRKVRQAANGPFVAETIAIGPKEVRSPWHTYEARSGTSVTVTSADNGKLIEVSNASPVTVTIPAASTSGNGWTIAIRNNGTANATVAGLVLRTGQGATFISDGTTYRAVAISPGLPIAVQDGGTGAVSSGDALTNLGAAAASHVHSVFSSSTAGFVPPPGAGSNERVLRPDGTWTAITGSSGGTVTSVGLTAPSFFSVSNSPITSSGDLAIAYASGLAARKFLASNASGQAGMRDLEGADIVAGKIAAARIPGSDVAGKEIVFFDDFENVPGRLNWTSSTSGGQVLSSGDAQHPGIVQLVTAASSAAATDRAAIRQGASAILFGGGFWQQEWLIRIPALSTATQEFVVQLGFIDLVSGDQTDGAYIEYDRATGGDFWRICTASNGQRTKNTSTVPVVAGSWVWGAVEVAADGSSASYYINGTQLLTPITTNIPIAAGRQTSVGASARKTVGVSTNQVMFEADIFAMVHTLTTARA